MGKILYFLCFILSVFPHRCKRESKAYSWNLLERQGNEGFTPFSYRLNKQDKDMKRILTFLLVAFATIVAHAQEGAWSGELDLGGTKLPLVFHFDAEGCTMDSPSQGAKGIKALKSYTPEGKIKVEIPMIGASFEGLVVMKMITGTFTQGGASFPLTLKPGEVKPNRPQTPKAPFPYTTEEVTFKSQDSPTEEFTLHGTITMPEGCTKETPALVMVTGSGQQNRDEEMMDHKPFAVIADALAREGIATLRFDDRGYNEASFPYLDFTVANHKNDAAAAVSVLRQRFNKVGVIGHSEGGTIVLMLASEGMVDFGVSLAGMAVSGKETLLEQKRTILSAAGLANDIVSDYCNALSEAFDDMAAHKPTKDLDTSTVPAVLKANFEATLHLLSSRYMRDFLNVDVRGVLPNIKCPILALNGKKDTQVNSTSNLDAIDKGLVNSRHETVEFDNLNHLFQHCQTGLLTEYQQIEETFASEALTKICTWIKSL